MASIGLPSEGGGQASLHGSGGPALDVRTDQFSLGATAYFMLTGRQAFPARRISDLRDVWRSKPIEAVRAHARGDCQRPSAVCSCSNCATLSAQGCNAASGVAY
jgi:hypothetical protein